MNQGIKIMQKIFNKRILLSTKATLAQADMENTHRKEVAAVLHNLSIKQKDLFTLGQSELGFPFTLPTARFISHSLVTGATGSGKSFCSLLLLNHVLKYLDNMSIGFIDPKGELAIKAIKYLYAHAFKLNDEERDNFLKKIIIIDFANPQKVTPYNILQCNQESSELLVNNRLETIGQIFQGATVLTPRMKSMLKYCLMLLIENELPITFFESVFFNETLLKQLANKSTDLRVKNYFLYRFDQEPKASRYALRHRIDSLFVSQGVRLSLSGKTAPDFRKLQDEGYIIICNLAGPNINRSTTEFLLNILISDIKQSVFQRQNTDRLYQWHLDEAQLLFKNRASVENMNDLLTMSRSFGSFFTLICQSLSSSVRDKDIINSILANIKWVLTLRSTLRDAQMISSAIPIYGNLSSNLYSSGGNKLSREQELKIRLSEISHFPERIGYIWLKSELTKAVKITTQELLPPHQIAGCSEKQFNEFCASLNNKYSNTKDETSNQVKILEEKLDAIDENESKNDINKSANKTENFMQILEHSYLKKQGIRNNKSDEKK